MPNSDDDALPRARRRPGDARTSEPRRSTPNIRRNDPCPCGSGKKYNRCCGGASVNQIPAAREDSDVCRPVSPRGR
jgi:hypothetical protein